MAKQYKDQATLRELYVEQGLNVYEVADELDCAPSTLRYWMDKFDIERRGESHEKATREQLIAELQRVADDLGSTPTYHGIGENGKYSGFPYQQEFGSWNKALTAAGIDVNKTDLVELACDNCGDAYEKSRHYLERNEQNFCSRECKHDYDRTLVECDHCGTEFECMDCYAENGYADLCSGECYREFRSVTYRGENHPRYREDTWGGSYGPNFEDQRERALESDGYKCRSCGMTSQEHRDRYGADLNCHHRERIGNFVEDGVLDYENANKLENLVMMCNACHMTWEALPVQIPV